jgi:putative iron-dependent peroxidase
MPATDADMILHIRSQRHDINYLLALRLFEQLTPAMQLDEMVHGFKYLDSRDLTGFVDGTENPEGKEREQVAIVANDAPFNGGSYLHLQKYQHQLNDWQALSLKQQEDSYGRTKAENIEYPAAQKSQCAHTKRTSIKDLQGKGIEILRHSLPFGDLNQSGLLFASYGASPESFNLMLESMCQLDENSATDSILRVTSAVSGHAFFAPNLDWFKQFQNS